MESLWDNPEFIQAEFHIGLLVTAALDTEVDRKNIKALYSSLKSTSSQIDVSALKPLTTPAQHGSDTFSAWI
jgi:hypothetical protein